MSPATQTVSGPFFDDLHVGLVADSAPALTLTEGVAAAHAAIVGNRMRLALDGELSRRVLGAALAHPALVWDVANGQSTLFTQRVIANLFYRGFMFRRAPAIGDTLHTKTEVVALRQNRPRPGRAATGLAALRVRTVDQKGGAVLDYTRCAMLPLRDPEGQTGHGADLETIGAEIDPGALAAPVEGWDLTAFREAAPGTHFAALAVGTIWEVVGGDVVSSAPELTRLTLNIAMAHHDAASSSAGRLVYGGHTIGLAAAQAIRALPNLVTIVAWHGCDHLAPVREGDTLRSTLELERAEPLAGGGGLVHLRSRVRADREGGSRDGSQDVLDWRFVGVMA
ncbi:MAG TPA: MaoC family dehydratase [Candidatus Binataceae bacterium]|nr:MaoC family dehydratase [Candidatus Binataceae bacterium]